MLKYSGKILFGLAVLLFITGCGSSEQQDPVADASPKKAAKRQSTASVTMTLYVGPDRGGETRGFGAEGPLMVKEHPEAGYRALSGSIQGFDHIPGYAYVLQVQPATNASYSLVKVLAKKWYGPQWEGIRWRLKDAIAESRPELLFEEGKLTGQGGVNRFFGNYRSKGYALQISQIGSTRMSGAPAAMTQEMHLLEALAQTAGFRVEEDDLLLLDHEGHVLLTFVKGS